MQENNTMAVYIAVFGRPADPEGFLWFSNETKGGTDFSTLGDITGTPEYLSRFASSEPADVIASLYQDLFNRVPENGGMAYWTEQLTSGALTIENIAINIALAAQGADRDTFANKTMAAHMFMSELDTSTEKAAYAGEWAEAFGRDFLEPVGTSYMPTDLEVQTAVDKLVSSDVSVVGTDQIFHRPFG
ncbi:hypothetical protein DEM27_12440 [Metarhizobium album]|uniref:DUF4214 domain-containing protein n=1 Tax=Metarhizobium album TaxID=2182425 RepID=A0A2U2DSF4_9HYPH|nr:DUF4214 domain-containing protein [Rhizobium album]PWE56228.1 hypothetical protein DEM27_12440 [Rhizobium album]